MNAILPRSNKRLLGRLYRSFDREPGRVLVLRIRSIGGLTWRVRDLEPGEAGPGARVLEVWRPNLPDLSFTLDGLSLAGLRDALSAAEIYLAYVTEEPELLVLSAKALVPGQGDQDASNGDHLHVHTAYLWSWADSVGRWLDAGRWDVREMLRQLVVRQSGGEWSDLWASYFGLARRRSEADAALNARTEYEWRRARSNPVAIEYNILKLLGERVAVREPWKEMFTLSDSAMDADRYFPSAEEFSYHRAQVISRTFPDWDEITREVEADRPAGTLFLPPVSKPWPWVVPLLSPDSRAEGGAHSVSAWDVRDYDGTILDYTLVLSESFPLLSPGMAMYEQLTFFGERTDAANDFSRPLNFSKGTIILSEQWPLGDLQAHLAGGQEQVEVGGPLVLSGEERLSDYEWRFEWRPIDEWQEASDGFHAAPLDLPALDPIFVNATMGGVVAIYAWAAFSNSSDPAYSKLDANATFWPVGELGDVPDANGGTAANAELAANSVAENLSQPRIAYGEAPTLALDLPGVNDDGWSGLWDKRQWRGRGYPSPSLGFATTREFMPQPVDGTLRGRAKVVAPLTTQIRLAASVGGRSKANLDPEAGRLYAERGGRATVTAASLTTQIQLAAQIWARATVAPVSLESGAVFPANGLGGRARVLATLSTGLRLEALRGGRASVLGAQLTTATRLEAKVRGNATAMPTLVPDNKLDVVSTGGIPASTDAPSSTAISVAAPGWPANGDLAANGSQPINSGDLHPRGRSSVLGAQLTTAIRLEAKVGARAAVAASNLFTATPLAALVGAKAARTGAGLTTRGSLDALVGGRARVPAATLTNAANVWPTANRTFAFDPGNDGFVTIAGGKIASLRDADGSTRELRQSSADLQPAIITSRTRRMLRWAGAYTSQLAADESGYWDWTDFRAPATFAMVFATPATLPTERQVFFATYEWANHTGNSCLLEIDWGASSKALRCGRAAGGAGYDVVSSSLSWAPSTRYLLVWVFNANGTMALYRNGVQLGLASNPAAPAGSQPYNVGTFGHISTPDGGLEFLAGDTGEMLRWTYAMTPAQVADLEAIAAQRYPGA